MNELSGVLLTAGLIVSFVGVGLMFTQRVSTPVYTLLAAAALLFASAAADIAGRL